MRVSAQIARKNEFLRAAKNNAGQVVAAMRRITDIPSTWEELAKITSLTIPEQFTNLPFDKTSAYLFAEYWKSSAEERWSAMLENKESNLDSHYASLSAVSGRGRTASIKGRKLGSIELKNFQEVAIKEILHLFYGSPTPFTNAILLPGMMGSGKTFVAAALAEDFFRNKRQWTIGRKFYFGPMFLYICPANIVPQIISEFVRAGLQPQLTSRELLIMSYSQMRSSKGSLFITTETTEEEHPSDPDRLVKTTTYTWNEATLPAVVVCDESHNLINANSKTVKIFLRLQETAYPPLQLFMSGTPLEKVNDALPIVVASRRPFMAMNRITPHSFKTFATSITARPDVASKASMQILRGHLKPIMVEFPNTKWAHVPRNIIKFYNFLTKEDQDFYDESVERLKEIQQKLYGEEKTGGRFKYAMYVNAHRAAVEPLRMDQIIDEAVERQRTGSVAPVIGCCYRASIEKAVLRLIKVHNYKRSDISIRWGPQEVLQQHLIMDDAELAATVEKHVIQGIRLTKLERRRMDVTAKFLANRIKYADETEKAQSARIREMIELRIQGGESAHEQEEERMRFQRQDSKFMLYTLASGGVGMSIPHDSDLNLPREGWFSPCYNGREFAQALYRAPRVVSLSDTLQRICLMANSVEQIHVAPILDNKLTSISELTKYSFEIDMSAEAIQKSYEKSQRVLANSDRILSLSADEINTDLDEETAKAEEDEVETDDE